MQPLSPFLTEAKRKSLRLRIGMILVPVVAMAFAALTIPPIMNAKLDATTIVLIIFGGMVVLFIIPLLFIVFRLTPRCLHCRKMIGNLDIAIATKACPRCGMSLDH